VYLGMNCCKLGHLTLLRSWILNIPFTDEHELRASSLSGFGSEILKVGSSLGWLLTARLRTKQSHQQSRTSTWIFSGTYKPRPMRTTEWLLLDHSWVGLGCRALICGGVLCCASLNGFS
jgi:hypothetical protein